MVSSTPCCNSMHWDCGFHMAMVHFPHPSRALRAAFWLSPLLTCAVGLLFVLISSTASLTIGVIAIVLALILSLYACWVNSRFHYATKVLSFTAASPPAKATTLINFSIILSNLYSCFLVYGIDGATVVGTWNCDRHFLGRGGCWGGERGLLEREWEGVAARVKRGGNFSIYSAFFFNWFGSVRVNRFLHYKTENRTEPGFFLTILIGFFSRFGFFG